MGFKSMKKVLIIMLALAAFVTLGIKGCSIAMRSEVRRHIPRAVKDFRRTYCFCAEDSLFMDRYVDTAVYVEGRRPVMIYSFGGGWMTGSRADKASYLMVERLVSLGYIVCNIDYRLRIAEFKAAGELNESNFVDCYCEAIDAGVEDIYRATRYILDHAEEWDVDTTRIVLAGSSAGAHNSLQAEYRLCRGEALARHYLPEDFDYGGVISMAGALWLRGRETPLDWCRRPCPVMFFHGSKDQLVAYDEDHTWCAAYGPVPIYRNLEEMGATAWFCDFKDGDHVLSSVPMFDCLDDICTFLDRAVMQRLDFRIHTVDESLPPKDFAHLNELYGDRFGWMFLPVDE